MSTDPVDAEGTASTASRREAKKVRTRRRLVTVSRRLFLEQGFDQTTLDQIGAEVGVHTMTLLRYFPTKAHLALAPVEDMLRDLRDTLEDPDRGETAITIWRAYVRNESVRYKKVAADYLAWVDSEPMLRSLLQSFTTECEDAMAAAVAHDAAVGPDDLNSILLATTLVRGNSAVARRWMRQGGPPEGLADSQLAVIDLAVGTFGPGRRTAL